MDQFTFDKQGICAIVYVGICWFILTPILLFYLYKYYKLYKRRKMGVRKKHFIQILTMEIGIISLVAVDRPLKVYNEFHANTQDSVAEQVGRVFFVLSFYAILTALIWRTWILYYDTRLNQWRENHGWKRIITPEKNEEDWYRTHRMSLGNSSRIGLYLCLVWFINSTTHYLLYWFLKDTKFKVTDNYYQVAIGAIYGICIFLIYIKIPSNQDIFRLRDELKFSLVIGIFIVIVFLINMLILKNDEWIYNFVEEIIYVLCCSGIALMSTAWVLFQLRYKTKNTFDGVVVLRMGVTLDRHRELSKANLMKKIQKRYNTEMSKSASSATKSSKSKSSTKSKSNLSINRDKVDSGSPATPASFQTDDTPTDDEKKNLNPFDVSNMNPTASFVAEKFNYVLNSEPQFELFMSHIKKEFSLENMLALIEFCQYEDLIIEQMDQMDNRKSFFRKYDFTFYESIPKSSIVHDKKLDIWEKHVKLFEKYVSHHADYELNLSHHVRTANTKLYADITKKSKNVNLNRVLDCVEQVLTAIRALLFDSFSRFDGTFDQPLQHLNFSGSYESNK